MTNALQQAFAAASPRITPRRLPVISLLIYLAVLALWLVLFGRSLWLSSIWAWSAGMVYIAYDTLLMLYVVRQTLPLAFAARVPQPVGTTPTGGRPSLGILIAAHNEAASLPAVLAAIEGQSDAPDLIMIADDGSRDDTASVLHDRYGLAIPAVGHDSIGKLGASRLHWLRLPHQGKARALNAAIVKADSDLVVTLDADTFMASDAIAEMRSAFAADVKLVAAGGILVPVCRPGIGGRLMQWFQTYEYIRNVISRFAWMRGNSLLLISGAFAGFRRDALIKVGGFDAECLVEDYELTHRLHRYSTDHDLGWQLRMIGSSLARTDAPSTVMTFLRQRRRWFAGFLQTQYWNRDMTGNRRYGRLGMRMLPIKALDTLQPIYGLTAFVLLVAFLAIGKIEIALPVFGLITAKIVADFFVYLWTVHLYRRLTGGRTPTSFAAATLAAVIEPFTFQLLRHAGATWGWIAFLRGSNEWGFAPAATPRRELPNAGE
ncbi:glycosyltransferase family 2 protein [Tardiphaga sp.]|uniref:glycosyltransferase family 2 protein n=1 Tax=Tardiphaga sp. TaxID=1926292 RepID=UPI0037D9F70D